MRRAEVADKSEMHPEDLARAGWDDFKFLSFATAQIGAGGEPLEPRHINVRCPFGPSINPVWIKRDVTHSVDPFFVCLQVLIDRTPARAAQRSICHQLQVRFGPYRDHSESGGKSHPAFRLDVLDH